MSNYLKLLAIEVAGHLKETVAGFSYLHWGRAVDMLLREDPGATWEMLEPMQFGDTIMVRCAVTAFGKAMTAQLPVMDDNNKAISNPNAFDVNTAMQRCLVKAIALHGLGFGVYLGDGGLAGDGAKVETPAPVEAASAEKLDELKKALAKGKKEIAALNQWLGRDPSEPVETLTLEQCDRALKAMAASEKKAA